MYAAQDICEGRETQQAGIYRPLRLCGFPFCRLQVWTGIATVAAALSGFLIPW